MGKGRKTTYCANVLTITPQTLSLANPRVVPRDRFDTTDLLLSAAVNGQKRHVRKFQFTVDNLTRAAHSRASRFDTSIFLIAKSGRVILHHRPIFSTINITARFGMSTFFCIPGRIQTCNLLFRKQLLYSFGHGDISFVFCLSGWFCLPKPFHFQDHCLQLCYIEHDPCH